jgi:hypothetical protein
LDIDIETKCDPNIVKNIIFTSSPTL